MFDYNPRDYGDSREGDHGIYESRWGEDPRDRPEQDLDSSGGISLLRQGQLSASGRRSDSDNRPLEMASLMPVSWNQAVWWLNQIGALRRRWLSACRASSKPVH